MATQISRGRRFPLGLGFTLWFAADPFVALAKTDSPNPSDVLRKKFRRVIAGFTSLLLSRVRPLATESDVPRDILLA